MHTGNTWLTTVMMTAVGLTGCDAEPAEELLAPGVAVASSEASTAASGGGATILRFQNIEFMLVFDAGNQLLSAHMPSNICGAGDFNVIDVLQVRTPSEIGQRIGILTSDSVQVAVYQAESPAEAGFAVTDIDFIGFGDLVDVGRFCAFLAGPNRIAEGTVRRISTFSFASFHARWTGTIQGVDGSDYHLTEIYQLNADAHDPNNPDTFAQQVASVRLMPLP